VPLPDLETLRTRADALGPDAVPPDLAVTFSVVLTDGEAWTLTFDAGRVIVDGGRTGEIAVLLDAGMAEEIADGRANAQQAIAAGRLRIEGDLDALPSARALATIGALLGPTTD
jgi:hypothetical protein